MFDQSKSGNSPPARPPGKGGRPQRARAQGTRPPGVQARQARAKVGRFARFVAAVAAFGFNSAYTAALAARRFAFSLYGQLLVLSLAFVVIVEAVLLVSSLAQDQERWLSDHMRQAELVSLSVDTAHENSVSTAMSTQLLKSAGVQYLAWNNGSRVYRLWPSDVVVPEEVINLNEMHKNVLHDLAFLWAPWQTLMSPSDRLLHVERIPQVRAGELIEIVVPADRLKAYLKSSVVSSLRLSTSISILAGLLVFTSLSIFIVHPIRQLTKAIIRFKTNPEAVVETPELSGRRDEIAHIAEELASMQEEVRQALRSRARLAALGQAVSKINHDLRNMLTAAQMASDRLASLASSDPSAAKALPRLERALDRALSLAQNVLTYGKSDERTPSVQIIRLKDLAEAAAEDAGLGIGAGALERVRFSLKAPKGFHFEADPEQLHRLLVNLMRNARQAIEMQPNRKLMGRVTVSAIKTADDVILIVSDNGPGIPEKIREKLFQPFTSSATPGGTGLGLAISRELAQIHGGDVRLVQTGPGGTAFEIRLPLKG